MAKKAGGLSVLLQGIPIPEIPPNASPEWQHWWRQMKEYLRRLAGAFTGENIVQTIIDQYNSEFITYVTNNQVGIYDWRWNAATHKFEVRRGGDDGSIGPWVATGGDQPVVISQLVEHVRNETDHTLKEEIATQVYVLSFADESISILGSTCCEGDPPDEPVECGTCSDGLVSGVATVTGFTGDHATRNIGPITLYRREGYPCIWEDHESGELGEANWGEVLRVSCALNAWSAVSDNDGFASNYGGIGPGPVTNTGTPPSSLPIISDTEEQEAVVSIVWS